MKKKYINLFIILVGITLILSGILLVLTNIYKDNRTKRIAQEDKIMAEIIADYKVFREKIEKFSDSRKKIYTDISEYSSYYLSIYNNYSAMVKKISDYELIVVAVDDSSVNLKDKCINKDYRKADVVNKCSAFVTNYEQTINGFVHDIELLNSKIEEYNVWFKSADKESQGKLKELNLIVPNKFKDFVDINNDNKYSGKIAE